MDKRSRGLFRSSRSDRGRELALVIAAALAVTTLLLLRTDTMTRDHRWFANPWDHHKYIHMAAGDPFGFHIAPFCWRVLDPLLAKLLPFDLQLNFMAISFIGIWAAGVAVYYLAKSFGFSRLYAFMGMVMFFSMGWATKYELYDFWLPDALSFFIVVLLIYCAVVRRDVFFVVLLALGVMVKESVIFVAPLYYSLNTSRPVDARLVMRTVLFTIPAVFVLLALRIAIPALNNDPAYLAGLPETLRVVYSGKSSYDFWQLLTDNGLARLHAFSLGALRSYSVGPFGFVLLMLPFFALRRNLALLARFSPFLLLVYAQLLFAVNTERLLVLAFPAVILAALNGLEVIARSSGIRPAWHLALPLALLVLNLAHVGSRPPRGSLRLELLIFVLYLMVAFPRRPADGGSPTSGD